MRLLNGNLLVRTGGGYQDLLDALGKLPAPHDFISATPQAAGVAAGGPSPMPSPRTPTVTAAYPSKLTSEEGVVGASMGIKSGGLAALSRQRSSSGGCSKLHPSNLPTPRSLDLSALHSGSLFSGSSGLLPSSRSRDNIQLPGGNTSSNGLQKRQSSMAADGSGSVAALAAMEAAVAAAVAAAVEAAANAGLDDGTGTSGGGAAPGQLVNGGQHSRAARLGRAMAAKTAAGTLIEAGMCPPVPVHEELSDAAALARSSTADAAALARASAAEGL